MCIGSAYLVLIEYREKESEAHNSLRTFSIDMLWSLSALCQRAGSWEKVCTIMEHSFFVVI